MDKPDYTVGGADAALLPKDFDHCIKQLQLENTGLKNALLGTRKTLDKYVEQYNLQSTGIAESVSQMERIKHTALEKVSSLREENELLKKEVQELSKIKDKQYMLAQKNAQDEIDELKEQLRDRNELIISLRQELRKAYENRAQMSPTASSDSSFSTVNLHTELDSVKDLEMTRLKEEIQRQKSYVEVLEETANKAREDYIEQKKITSKLTNEKRDLVEINQILQGKLKHVEDTLEVKDFVTVEGACKQCKQMEDEKQQMASKMTALQTRLDKAVTRILDAETKCKKYEQIMQQQEQKMKLMDVSAAGGGVDESGSTTETSDVLFSIRRAKAMVQQQHEEPKQIAEYKQKVAELEDQIRDKDELIQVLSSQYEDSLSDSAALQQRIQTLEGELETITAERETLAKAHEKTTKDYKDLLSTYYNLLEESRVKEKAYDDLEKREQHIESMEKLKANYTKMQQVATIAEERYHKVMEDNEKLLKENDELKSVVQIPGEAAQAMDQRDPEGLLDAYKAQAAVFEKDFQEERESRQELNDKCCALQAQVDQLQKEKHQLEDDLSMAAIKGERRTPTHTPKKSQSKIAENAHAYTNAYKGGGTQMSGGAAGGGGASGGAYDNYGAALTPTGINRGAQRVAHPVQEIGLDVKCYKCGREFINVITLHQHQPFCIRQ